MHKHAHTYRITAVRSVTHVTHKHTPHMQMNTDNTFNTHASTISLSIAQLESSSSVGPLHVTKSNNKNRDAFKPFTLTMRTENF